jgi:hypothetical protein
MALTVITTPGASDANSYCSVAEGDAYHATHLWASKWTDSDPETKAIAVVMATRLLDTMVEWAEWSTTAEQALRWPRTGVIAADGWDLIDEMEIPQELKNATAEFARQLIVADRTTDSLVDAMGLRSFTAGPVSMSFKDYVPPKVMPDAVMALLPSWWGHLRNVGSVYELSRS